MSVIPFDSSDELFEHERRAREIADARVRPWQAQVKPGDCFVRETSYGFKIYGEVLPEEEPREPACQHYRLARCYPVACPDGELGDIHVSVIERLLSAEQFEAARARRWQA